MIAFNIHRRGVMLHLLFFGLLVLVPANLRPSPDLEIETLSAEEIALLEELALWVEPGQDLLTLREAIRQRSKSFEVFRRFHGENQLATRLEILPFGSSIRQTATRYQLDALLLASIIEVESGFDPNAISRRGATGLMQVMPATAGEGVHLSDPEDNLATGAKYLRRLLRRYGGNLELALAAYNAGPSNVRRYGGVPPFRETTHYVEKVLEIYVDHHRQVWRNSETAERLTMM